MTQYSLLLWAGTQSAASWRLYSKPCPDGCEVHTARESPQTPRCHPADWTGVRLAILSREFIIMGGKVHGAWAAWEGPAAGLQGLSWSRMDCILFSHGTAGSLHPAAASISRCV